MMKKRILSIVITLLISLGVQAQIDPQVIEVLNKSQEKMISPYGREIEMTIDVTLMVKLNGMKIRALEKDNITSCLATCEVLKVHFILGKMFGCSNKIDYLCKRLRKKSQ